MLKTIDKRLAMKDPFRPVPEKIDKLPSASGVVSEQSGKEPVKENAPVQSIADPIVSTRQVHLYYGKTEAVKNISMDFPRHEVTALIGPSGCGKSTLLRCLNRMNDLIDDVRTTGRIEFDGQDINDKAVDVIELRRRVGMVFQKPTPFPKSIYENVAYGLRIAGVRRKSVLDEVVERSLRGARYGTK